MIRSTQGYEPEQTLIKAFILQKALGTRLAVTHFLFVNCFFRQGFQDQPSSCPADREDLDRDRVNNLRES